MGIFLSGIFTPPYTTKFTLPPLTNGINRALTDISKTEPIFILIPTHARMLIKLTLQQKKNEAKTRKEHKTLFLNK
jgi:hypothetical protein